MKLGIIGAGKIVREFLPKLIKMPELEIRALLCGPRHREEAEELCRSFGVPETVTTFDELCAAGIDTVYIAVPNHLHFEYCRRALEAGCNVIVEKPMTSDFREAEKLGQLAESRGLMLFEAITTRYFPGYEMLREWLPEIGTVKQVNCSYCQYSSRYDAFRRGEILPAFDPACAGGALMDLNLYNVHFVMGLFGCPDSADYLANIEKGIDTSGTLLLRYPGMTAVCTAAKDCSAPFSFVIAGTDGYLTTQYPPNLLGRVTLHRNRGAEECFDDEMSQQRMLPEFRFFADCIARQDYAACRERLTQSLAVSKVLTEARRKAGIFFPADEMTF